MKRLTNCRAGVSLMFHVDMQLFGKTFQGIHYFLSNLLTLSLSQASYPAKTKVAAQAQPPVI